MLENIIKQFRDDNIEKSRVMMTKIIIRDTMTSKLSSIESEIPFPEVEKKVNLAVIRGNFSVSLTILEDPTTRRQFNELVDAITDITIDSATHFLGYRRLDAHFVDVACELLQQISLDFLKAI